MILGYPHDYGNPQLCLSDSGLQPLFAKNDSWDPLEVSADAPGLENQKGAHQGLPVLEGAALGHCR